MAARVEAGRSLRTVSLGQEKDTVLDEGDSSGDYEK